MGYKKINLQTQVQKGSVTPSKVIEEQQKKKSICLSTLPPLTTTTTSVTSETKTSCCETLNKNIHRWWETKFSMCPVSCFPFKLGDKQSYGSSTKQPPQQQVQTKQPQPSMYRVCSAVTGAQPMYVDSCSAELWDYDIISVGGHQQSGVIDRDVNNSFKFMSAQKAAAAASNVTEAASVEVKSAFSGDTTNKRHGGRRSGRYGSSGKHRRRRYRRRSTSGLGGGVGGSGGRHNKEKRSPSITSLASLKLKFENRLNRIKRRGDEKAIDENIEMREEQRRDNNALSKEISKSTPVITFSSIFGDASLFESDEADTSKIENSDVETKIETTKLEEATNDSITTAADQRRQQRQQQQWLQRRSFYLNDTLTTITTTTTDDENNTDKTLNTTTTVTLSRESHEQDEEDFFSSSDDGGDIDDEDDPDYEEQEEVDGNDDDENTRDEERTCEFSNGFDTLSSLSSASSSSKVEYF